MAKYEFFFTAMFSGSVAVEADSLEEALYIVEYEEGYGEPLCAYCSNHWEASGDPQLDDSYYEDGKHKSIVKEQAKGGLL